MKKVFKILLYILGAIVAYCAITFSVGFVNGLYKSYKIRVASNKIRAAKQEAKTFFGITLDQELNIPEKRIVGFSDNDYNYRMKYEDLTEDFDVSALAREFTMRKHVVVLDNKFYNTDTVVTLISDHDEKVRAIAACMSWDNQMYDCHVDGFGAADETCDKIRSVLEEKYHCKMNQLSAEPTFVKKFIIRPGRPYDILHTKDDDRSDVYISKKSCFMVSPDFFASIFVIGYKSELYSGRYCHKNYLILFINTPDLDSISKREKELDARDREMQVREENARERKEAFNAL